MQTTVKQENEQIQAKNREMKARAYENMSAALGDKSKPDGINIVLKFFNVRGRVDESLPLSDQLEQIEQAFFIKTRYAELEKDWYVTAAVPMLVQITGGHWKAVIPKSDGRCVYVENGRKIKITPQNAALFTSSALYFYPSMHHDTLTMRNLLRFMLRCSSKTDRLTVLIASVLTTLSGLLVPWVNRLIFARIVPTGAMAGISAATALLLSSVLVAAVLSLLQSLILTNAMLRMSTYVQSAIFSRLLSLETGFFKTIKSGELSRIVMEFSDISKTVSVKGISACIGMALSPVYLIQIYQYAPVLFGPVVLSTALLGILMLAESTLQAKWMQRYETSLSKMSGFCYELFCGIEQVKLAGAQERMMRRWSEYYLRASQDEDKPFLLQYAPVLYKLIRVLTTAAIFLFGARLAASDYIAFSAAYGAYVAASAGMTVMIQMLAHFRTSYALIAPVLHANCEQRSAQKKKPQSLCGEITLSNLSFRYDKDTPYVLNGLSAHIRAGESVGIIGTSGCGKSTLLRLLLGFEKAEQGSIYIDGFDIRELDLQSYRQKIGAVLQNTGLISGDIYANITITKPNASMDEVKTAIEMAGLTETIEALPMGIHTPISQENCTLSGGQRQRVLIARALIANPSILMLDEATSALDNMTQSNITRSLNRLVCTKLIVAHRLSTIEHCDKILVMDKGRIVQQGTWEQLKHTEGLFQQLIKRQTTHP